MKNSLFLILCFFLVISSCQQQPVEEDKKATLQVEPPSELASLMRDMKVQSELIREAVISNDSLPIEVIEIWQKIHTAKPTEPSKSGPAFEGFSRHFIEQTVVLYSDSSIKKSDAFNNIVNSCIQCHQEYCPGPIKTISKLTIPNS
jgi:hypothetical protein